MIKNVLTHIDGVELYGIVSILLFFACFTATLVWALRLKRTHLERMGELPLHDDPPSSSPANRQSESRHE